MKTLMTRLANTCARLSCERWNRFRSLRAMFRMAYLALGECGAEQQRRQVRRTERSAKTSPQAKAPKTRPCTNTYPWPYREPEFANWPVCYDLGERTLVTDPAGFPVRHCTSYCAWKICELTGRWPTVQPEAAQISPAKDWQRFLAANDYTNIVETPMIDTGRHYVGIAPNEGWAGQVYWYEGHLRARRTTLNGWPHHEPATIRCSTYTEHGFVCLRFRVAAAKKLLWVQLD